MNIFTRFWSWLNLLDFDEYLDFHLAFYSGLDNGTLTNTPYYRDTNLKSPCSSSLLLPVFPAQMIGSSVLSKNMTQKDNI